MAEFSLDIRTHIYNCRRRRNTYRVPLRRLFIVAVTSGTDFAFLDFPGVLVASSMFDLATCC
jgi:hypothetical protein